MLYKKLRAPINDVIIVLQDTCAATDSISLVARILRRSKTHLQSMLLQNNPAIVEDFYAHLVHSYYYVLGYLLLSALQP